MFHLDVTCRHLLWPAVILSLGLALPHPAAAAKGDLPAVFDVPYLNNVLIDGKADDWGARGLRLDVLTPINARLRPAADFDARARLGWDEHGLLVLADVRDDEFVEAKDENSLWDRDSVELFLAPQRGAADAYQVAISPGLDPDHASLRSHFQDHRKDKNLQQVHAPIMAVRTKTEHGYVLEALLPWENLGIKPAVGREVAFQIAINDWDTGSAHYQVMWYPKAGADSDTNKMQPLRLAQQAGPPVNAVATGAYERFRRTRLDVIATGDLAGKPVEVHEGKRRLGRMNLASDAHLEYGGKAMARMILPMPPRGQAYGPLTVSVAGRTVSIVTLDDPDEARRQAFAREPLVFHPYVFNGAVFPSCDFQDPSLVEDTVGTYMLKTTFYDADYNPVKSATRPGRYGAIVDVTTEDGQHYRRFATLFRQPEETNWRKLDMPFTVVFPPQLGIDPVVTEEQKTTVSDALKQQFIESTRRAEDTAVLLAGLYETRPGDPAVARTDTWHRDARWWYDLKQKTGDLKPLRYLLYLPQGYNDDTTKHWPLMLFLHGSGERGDDLDKVKVHGPPKLVAAGKQFPFIIVSPQCPDGEWWVPQQLSDLLDSVSAQYRVDADRVYLTGLSMGGYGTWELATEYPDRFAAIAPICGVGDARDVERIKHLPVWAFHGGKDPTVPLEADQKVVDALKQVDDDVKFTVYPDAGHDSWTVTYDNPELYTWFLQHKRGAGPE